ncbi:MAG TPA: hypothetical protein VGH99_14665 [Pseudonocardia sp.]|jgi:hypothetical protein
MATARVRVQRTGPADVRGLTSGSGTGSAGSPTVEVPEAGAPSRSDEQRWETDGGRVNAAVREPA